jgi:hypothetical protein
MAKKVTLDDCLEDSVRVFIWVIYLRLEFDLLNRNILGGN